MSRALPLVDGRSWAGKAAGANRCVCCGETIARAECEHEPQAHAGLYAHARGYTLWVGESTGLRGRDLVGVNQPRPARRRNPSAAGFTAHAPPRRMRVRTRSREARR